MSDEVCLVILFRAGGHMPVSVSKEQAKDELLRYCEFVISVKATKTVDVLRATESYAFLLSDVVGMYWHEGVSPQERIASVLEKQATEGDDWKANQ
jgi:hypothetical protein